ncbi:MAG: hypothetical protein RXR51_04940 [Nitrososphaeria archaeon]
MSSVIFYSTKKVERFIRSRDVFPEDLMYLIQTFFEKNEASKIKYVRFALNDVIEEDKRVRRSLEVEICAGSLSNELLTELNETLAREFPNLPAFFTINCRRFLP